MHWAVWDLPATTTGLPASFPGGAISEPAGAKQAGFGTPPGYFGSGACGHVYELRIYALSVAALSPTPNDLNAAGAAITASDAILAESFVRLQSRDYCDT